MKKNEELPQKMSFKQAWKDFFIGYVDFEGRSTRAGFWWVNGIYYPLLFGLSILMTFNLFYTILSNNTKTTNEIPTNMIFPLLIAGIFLLIFRLGFFLPSLALIVRRMRDVGIRGRGQGVLVGIYFLTMVLFLLNFDDIAIGILPTNGIRWIGIGIIVILSLLPSGALETNSKSSFLTFFFENKGEL